MTSADLDIVNRFAIEGPAPHPRETGRGWIAPFHVLFVLKREYEASGREIPEFEHLLDIAINNLEEDLHASIENVLQGGGRRASVVDQTNAIPGPR